MIDEAEALLHGAHRMNVIGRFQLEAAVQSAHAVRRLTGNADWHAVLNLYDALWRMTGSPVVAINRAIAVAQIGGAAAGLAALDDQANNPLLLQYQPYWAARAELLARTGAIAEADAAYERAMGLEADPAIRDFLHTSCRPCTLAFQHSRRVTPVPPALLVSRFMHGRKA